MNILITGAAGYIGQCLEKIIKNKNVILLDKKKIKYKTNKKFLKINLLNKKKLNILFKKEKIDTIIHLAGESLVNENKNYNLYYKNNIQVLKNILNVMEKNKSQNLIFSSTASVYRFNCKPVTEKSKLDPKSKYARTKLECEKLIKRSGIRYIILRFFNVASSLPAQLRGENHSPETHLIPLFISKIIKGDVLNIYGNNYKTQDGTCVRDFIHIKDICSAIIKSAKLIKKKKIREIINIGTNKGFSVKKIFLRIQKYAKYKAKLKIKNKRKGDTPYLVSDFKKAKKILDWHPKYSNLDKIISDEFKWKKINLN